MSVAAAAYCKFNPFIRPLNISPPGGILGRWYGKQILAGDATGGIYTITLNISDVAGLFPSPVLADLRGFNLYDQNGGLGASGACRIEIATGEYAFYGGQDVRWSRYLNFASVDFISCTGGDAIIPKYPFTIARERATATVVSMVATPNTNGHSLVFEAFGLIYDERYYDGA